MKNVLLFGSTGAVGRGCLDALTRRDDVSLVIAGRDEARLRAVISETRAPADIEIARLDLTDSAAVTAAVSRCDIVINCAGPSQRLSADVAGVAVAAGVPYVDPAGDQALLDRLVAAGTGVPVVLQAGVQPGLSGLLLRVLAQDRTDITDNVTAWCGGLQPLTPASVLEYLASLHDIHSHPGSALVDGAVRRVGRGDSKPAPTQYFPDTVTVHPHLDVETVAVAGHLGIGNVSWLNVFDGVHTTRAMQLLALDDERGADLGPVLAAARLDLFGRQPYFAIVCTSGATTVAFTCPDSYRVTGALAAFAAQHVADMPAGVRSFWSLDEPRSALEFVAEAVPEAEFSVVDESMIEEGSL